MRKTIFQFFHWYYPAGKLWKDVAKQAAHLQWLGITDVWLPPAYKSSAGANGVGYDVYDLFDLGEFDFSLGAEVGDEFHDESAVVAGREG